MKKILLVVSMVAILCVLCTAIASAEDVPPVSVEEKYNISYYEDVYYISENTEGKITSYEELEAIFPNNGFILSMYDEAFFEDKFLYRIGYVAPDPSYDVKVSSVAESQDSVSIEVTVTDNEAIVPDVVVPWVIFLEFDKSYLDKEISSNLKSRDLEGLAKISYYGRLAIIDSRLHGRDDTEPQRRKVIKSVAELEKFVASMPKNSAANAKFNSVISAYDEDFFKDNFLVFVAWMYPTGGTIDYSISDVRDNNGVVSITTLETNLTPPGHMTTQAEESWTILYEIDASALESGYSMIMKTVAEEVDIITYNPSQFKTVTPEAVHNKAFGEDGVVLAEISLGADNAQRTVMVGSTELYYSVERDKHVGVVDVQYVADNKITSVTVIDKTPVVVTYGDVNDFSYGGTVTSGDLYQLKLYMQGASSLYDKALIMADVSGDGQINSGDILQLKLFLTKDRPFSVLSK